MRFYPSISFPSTPPGTRFLEHRWIISESSLEIGWDIESTRDLEYEYI